jgi:hypothetical protein
MTKLTGNKKGAFLLGWLLNINQFFPEKSLVLN